MAAEDVQSLDEQWAAAEVRGDVAALEQLATEDFTLVGPFGFVLDRAQWLARYAEGGLLSTRALEWQPGTTQVRGDVAVVVGVHTQQATYDGNPADGRFRSTHVAVREDDGWRLWSLQLSPIPDGAPS